MLMTRKTMQQLVEIAKSPTKRSTKVKKEDEQK